MLNEERSKKYLKLAGALNIQGTPYSAGFGLSELVGPLNYINLTDDGWTINIFVMVSTSVILPVLLNGSLLYVFSRKFKMIRSKDYKLDLE
ncbi:MAG TPA: PTS sugar transporter subunit IIC [Candidatus Avamphibacillus sp.]|nr:PTS sugar transporter subunit IIC [Candidatus Avamphibacillus sp.]